MGFAFWSVMLIGVVDATISFVRIEGLLPNIVGDDLALALGKPALRGFYIHIPLLIIGMIICLLYTSPSPRDKRQSRMPSSA